MPPEPGMDPVLWLAAAREHLATVENATVPVRVRCFCGQRTVELSVKAVLIHHGVKFPFVHALQELIALVPGGVPEVVHEAAGLTAYAVEEMYPDTFTDLTGDHAAEAAEQAGAVVTWAVSILEPHTDETP